MGLLGIAPESVSALLLTHEHSDHVCGADVLTRRYRLPVYATDGTRDGSKLAPEVRERCRRLASGLPVEVAGFQVEPFAIPHDAAEPVGFTIEDSEGHRVGLAADLGSRSRLAWGRMADLDCLVLETNHDLGMLRNGPYPWSLKQRVAGSHGHLSNEDAAGGVPELVGDLLRWVVCYHLSQTNNSPALAAETIGEVLDREGSRARVELTWQDRPTGWLEVG
jgi:phosphoribosyl 1,2-cyclic phosphodiesterase